MQQRSFHSAVHPDDPDAAQTFWTAYPDLDGRAVDFYGETIDPVLVRTVRLKAPHQASEPVRPGMIAFLRGTVGLTEKECEAFVLAEGYDASESQIAVALGITQQSVNERLSNARRRCRRWTELRQLTPLAVAA